MKTFHSSPRYSFKFENSNLLKPSLLRFVERKIFAVQTLNFKVYRTPCDTRIIRFGLLRANVGILWNPESLDDELEHDKNSFAHKTNDARREIA